MGASTDDGTADPTARTPSEPRLADALVQFARLIDHLFADASREHGLTRQQAQPLCELMHGPVGMTDLTAPYMWSARP